MSYNQKEDIGYIKRDMCLTNNLDTIKLLIKEGLDINSLGIGGHTPIHHHVKNGNFKKTKGCITLKKANLLKIISLIEKNTKIIIR